MDKLGDRLARHDPCRDEDLDRLNEVVLDYDEAQAVAEGLVRAVLGIFHERASVTLSVTSRTKTTGTIIEKLRRPPHTSLKSMQDIAGLRIVGPLLRSQQDEVGALIVKAFDGIGSRPPTLLDRRETPTHGYRALHVVVHVDDVPVEIQIRTVGQDDWAQVMEKLADVWGRQLRYGGAPDDQGDPGLLQSRVEAVKTMMASSNAIASIEVDREEIEGLDQSCVELLARLQATNPETESSREERASSEASVLGLQERISERRQMQETADEALRAAMRAFLAQVTGASG